MASSSPFTALLAVMAVLSVLDSTSCMGYMSPTASTFPFDSLSGMPMDQYVFQVPLSGSSEVQMGDTGASGIAELGFMYMSSTYQLSYSISVYNLTDAPPIAQHIHMGAANSAGAIVVNFTGTWFKQNDTAKASTWLLQGMTDYSGLTSPLNETFSNLVGAILTSPTGFYVNVHTMKFPGGALRGQLSTPGIWYAVALSGNEGALPADKAASGQANIIFYPDGSSYLMAYSITAYNLTSPPPIYQHIHMGAAGTSGPVVIPFQGTWIKQGMENTWMLMGEVKNSSAEMSNMTTTYTQVIQQIMSNPEGYYVNVHTTTYPEGAIRGQFSSNGLSPSSPMPPGMPGMTAPPPPKAAVLSVGWTGFPVLLSLAASVIGLVLV